MKNGTILIVEDDADIRDNLEELLLGEGYSVQLASNGQEALDLLRSSAGLPHLILLDVMMPVKDGFAFREEQGRDVLLATLPVVIMTADPRIEEKRILMGVKAAVRKPFDIELLLRAVEQSIVRR